MKKKLWDWVFKKRWWERKWKEKREWKENREWKKWEKNKKKEASFYAKASDVKSAFYTNQPIFILLYRGACFNTNEFDESLPNVVVSLL